MSKEIYSESMFIDSGAHSLYNIHVLGHQERMGKHGRELEKPPVRWSQGDFSYFDLRRGTPFREYCDAYARFQKQMVGRDVICANVDAISNPDLTWQIQKFFEEECGVYPVPIVHFATPMKYVDRYVEGGYDLLGVGGLGQGVSRHEYFKWANEFFIHICPESNKRLPVIKTHGFAMTSWELMTRYPWWSVDSATWVKLSAYGWLYIPRWLEGRWRFDKPPFNINFSFRSPQLKNPAKHYANAPKEWRWTARKWLQHIGLEMGSVDEKGKTVEFGVTSHHRARSIANLTYLKDLEESRPEWPHPLSDKIIKQHKVRSSMTFGV
jgi:hypothetical protein